MKTQYVTRKGSFDSGHRVVHQVSACRNLHGHTYIYELEFKFNEMEDIGYAIDFKEIKRVGCQWIDDFLDHGMIVNPKDQKVIDLTNELGNKLWVMSLKGSGEFCNPTVENIAKELFLAMSVLFKGYDNLSINRVILWETPNCYTKCSRASISDNEAKNWLLTNQKTVESYSEGKGVMEYDERKIPK